MSQVVRTGTHSLFVICEVVLVTLALGRVQAFAVGPLPCGEVTIPQCGGTCPSGQRCIATNDTHILVAGDASCGPNEPFEREAAEKNGDCHCGGVPGGGGPVGTEPGRYKRRVVTLG